VPALASQGLSARLVAKATCLPYLQAVSVCDLILLPSNYINIIGMILNKVTIAPFFPPPSPKDLPATPRLLNRNKKMQNSNLLCQMSSDKEKDPLHFDDTICFT
jgi:hypothetical protein